MTQTQNKDQITLNRRDFSRLMLMFMSLMGVANTARAGLDVPKKRTGKRRPDKNLATAAEAHGCKLAIDFPTEEGWYVIHALNDDDWKRIEVDPDEVSPRLHGQLMGAKLSPWGTPILARVIGDPVAILSRAQYFAPGEPDDREEGDFSAWRIEWFGDGIQRVVPDNNSWWQARLAVPEKFSKRERAFVAAWLEENDGERSRGINNGCGLAQDLMLSTHRYEKPAAFEPWLTNRERKILATFVQWLGTNCGQSFLHQVKRKGGLV